MWAVAPEVEAVELPVGFLNIQDNGLISGVWRGFEAFRVEALEPKAESVSLPVQDLQAVSRFVEKHEDYGVEHRHFDIQYDQRGQTLNGPSEVDWLTLASGRIMACVLQKEIGSTASGIS